METVIRRRNASSDLGLHCLTCQINRAPGLNGLRCEVV